MKEAEKEKRESEKRYVTWARKTWRVKERERNNIFECSSRMPGLVQKQKKRREKQRKAD